MAHVVFVGLGFGGLYALRGLLDQAPEGLRVTAVDRRDRFVFTPLLYEYLVGELEPDVVAPPYDTLLPPGAVERIQAEAREVDVRAREVLLADGRRIPFDVLVLAPGSTPAFHGVAGAEAHAFPFYSFDDADRLKATLQMRAWAQGDQPVCVVGGGVVGIELAFALAELLGGHGWRGTEPRVIVLEAMPEILRLSSEGMRERAKAKLAAKGIEVRTGVKVLEVDDRGVLFQEGGREQRFEAAAVAWAAGIRPNPLLDALPAERHGVHGLRVERTLQLPGFPHVFVVGDAISYPGRVTGEPLPDTAQAAVQESEVCAANVRHWVEERLARETFQYTHLGDFLRVSGHEAIADVKGVVLDGAAASLARRAAYLFRLPAWAIRTAAIRQWLG
ncbi:MAG TPA: FAD-dependent oxidoreductase [Longimicrobiales bacterium]